MLLAFIIVKHMNISVKKMKAHMSICAPFMNIHCRWILSQFNIHLIVIECSVEGAYVVKGETFN